MPPAVKSKEAIAKAAAAGGRQKKKVRRRVPGRGG